MYTRQLKTSDPVQFNPYEEAFKEVKTPVKTELDKFPDDDIFSENEKQQYFVDIDYRINLINKSDNSEEKKYNLLCGYLLTLNRYDIAFNPQNNSLLKGLLKLNAETQNRLIENYYGFARQQFTAYQDVYDAAKRNLSDSMGNNDNDLCRKANSLARDLDRYIRTYSKTPEESSFHYKLFTHILNQTAALLDRPFDEDIFNKYKTLVDKLNSYNHAQFNQSIMQKVKGFLLGVASIVVPTLLSVIAFSHNPYVGIGVTALCIVGGLVGLKKARSFIQSGQSLFAKAQDFKTKILAPIEEIKVQAPRRV